MRSGASECEVGQVLAGLAAVSTVDVSALPDAQLRAEVLDLVRAYNQVSTALAQRIGSFDLRDLARADGLRSTATWLADFARVSKPAALRWIGRAALLRQLPALAAAAGDGAVSDEQLAQVRELIRRVGVEKVRPFDELLAALCATVGPAEVARACQRIYAYLDPDGPPPDDDGTGQRELSFAQVGRSLYLRGRLDAEGAAIVQTAIDALMRPPAPGDQRSAGQRRADALVDLARAALAGGTMPDVGGERPHVGLLITPEILLGTPPAKEQPATEQPATEQPATQQPATLQTDPQCESAPSSSVDDLLTAAGVPDLPVRPWLSWVGEVSTALAQRLACDGIIWRLIVDPRNGLPLDVGDRYRVAPPWIRKALWARDRTCRWPGCDTPAPWTDAHHLVPWWKQHKTSVAGLVSLCRYHHGLVHEGQWTLRFDHTTGEVSITRPDGSPYELGPSKPWTTPSHQGPRQRPNQATDPPWPAAA